MAKAAKPNVTIPEATSDPNAEVRSAKAGKQSTPDVASGRKISLPTAHAVNQLGANSPATGKVQEIGTSPIAKATIVPLPSASKAHQTLDWTSVPLTTITLDVAASGDDVRHRGVSHPSDGHFNPTDIQFPVGDASAITKQVSSAARFLNVTIPQGTVIKSAILRLTGQSADPDVVARSYVFGEAVANASQITIDAEWHTARTAKTSAQVDWTVPPFTSRGDSQDSPDISTVIQEIINLPGWVSGNALNIFWDDDDGRSDSGAFRAASSYDDTEQAPQLIITYGTLRLREFVPGARETGQLRQALVVRQQEF